MRGPWRRLSSVLSLALVGAAIWVLHRELRDTSLEQIASDLAAFPARALAASLALTAVNYLILTGYDQLGFRYIGRAMSSWRVTLAAFVGFAISNNVGFAVVSGTSARYRFYSRWGITGQDLWRVVVFYSVTFWLGLILLGGWSLAVSPVGAAQTFAPPAITRGTGWVLLAIAISYPLLLVFWRRPVTVGGVVVPRPPLRLAALQFLLSTLDWIACAAALYVLLPPGGPPFDFFLSAFLAAQLTGLISHVPGGLGVFESAMLLLLKPWFTAEQFLPALAAFRILYYLLPLVAAMAVLLADEFRQRSTRRAGWGSLFGSLPSALAPKLLALVTLLAGAVLIFAGVAPARPARLAVLDAWWPLPAVEVAYLVTTAGGLLLLAVSWGVARRLIRAYRVAIVSLAAGGASAVMKGLHVEAALAAAGVLALAVAARREFQRPASWLTLPVPPVWMVAVVGVGLGAVGVALVTAHEPRLEPSIADLLAPSDAASRAVRASALVLVGLVAVAAWQLRRVVVTRRDVLTAKDWQDLEEVTRHTAPVLPCMTWHAERRLVWKHGRDAVVLHAVAGTTWVAIGDPVGEREAARSALARFLDRVEDHAGVPVLHEVSREWLPIYIEAGFTFARLGDEARVPLTRRLPDALPELPHGLTFRVLSSAEVDARHVELREVTDDWAAHTGSRAPARLEHDPWPPRYVAVVEDAGHVVAFCTLVTTPARVELALDLVRHRARVPATVGLEMAAEAARWGARQGFGALALGVLPVSVTEDPALAALQARLGRFLYPHVEEAPDLQELRRLADRFAPEWQPRYIAYPGGLPLGRVLSDVAALVTGEGGGVGARPRIQPTTPR